MGHFQHVICEEIPRFEVPQIDGHTGKKTADMERAFLEIGNEDPALKGNIGNLGGLRREQGR